jgi:hypothetical protein
MARGGPSAFEHAKTVFGFTDEDFVNALKAAKPGLFIYREQWEKWNKTFEIDPPLPFPIKFFEV